MRKRKEHMPRKKHSEPATKLKFDKNIFGSHKHPNTNSNAIGNNQNLFQHTRNTFEKIGASYNNTVKQKQKNFVLFTDSVLKLLCMKEFNKNINGGIAHFKPFPGLKVKQMDHHDIPVLEECQYDAAAIHVDINDLLKSRTNIDVNEITKGIINIFLRYRSHNIAKIVYSVYSDTAPSSSRELLAIQATLECRFTLKLAHDIIITYSQMHLTDKYSQHSSIIWQVWLNG